MFVALAGAPASASVIFTFTGGPNSDFSDTTDNTGGSLTVTITDIAGGVELAFQNNFVDAGAWPGAFYFNTTVAPLAEPGTTVSCVLCADIGAPSFFDVGSNEFKADGDGKYDILINMDNGNRLTPGESATLKILSSTAGFNAASFLSLSLDAGGHGPFQAALHLQSLPNNGSDWLASEGRIVVTQAPEPGSILLLATALLGGARRLTRKSRTNR